jgi:hypothetical protein
MQSARHGSARPQPQPSQLLPSVPPPPPPPTCLLQALPVGHRRRRLGVRHGQEPGHAGRNVFEAAAPGGVGPLPVRRHVRQRRQRLVHVRPHVLCRHAHGAVPVLSPGLRSRAAVATRCRPVGPARRRLRRRAQHPGGGCGGVGFGPRGGGQRAGGAQARGLGSATRPERGGEFREALADGRL